METSSVPQEKLRAAGWAALSHCLLLPRDVSRMCRDSLCGACCLPGTSQTSSESKNLLGSFPPSLKNLAVIPEQGARRAQQKKKLNKPQLNGSRRARLCPSCAGAATWGCGGETLPEPGTRQRCPVGAGHVEGFFCGVELPRAHGGDALQWGSLEERRRNGCGRLLQKCGA